MNRVTIILPQKPGVGPQMESGGRPRSPGMQTATSIRPSQQVDSNQFHAVTRLIK